MASQFLAWDHASPYYPFMSLTGRGHDTFLCRITCKKARIWTFFWLDQENNLLVVVHFSLHFCLRNEQWIHTRVRIEISAGSVFLKLKNAKIEISSIEIFSISSYSKKLQSKVHPSFECNLIPATNYRGDKRVHFSNNQFMNGIVTCTVPQMIPNRKWSRDRKWFPKWIANDPRPQVIPKVDRKWSRENLRNGMEWILWDWLQKRTDYKKETFFSRLLKKKRRRTLHLRSIYTRRKKNGINLKRYGINRMLLSLSIASIFFQECFVFWKI